MIFLSHSTIIFWKFWEYRVSHYFSHALLFTFISSENLKQVFKFDNAEKNYFIGVSSRAFGTKEYTALGKNTQFSEGLECSFGRTF